MFDFDFNLLVVFDVLLSEVSVVGVVCCLNFSILVMSWILSRLCDVIGDLILVCVGCNMVLILWVEVIWDCVRCVVYDVRVVL